MFPGAGAQVYYNDAGEPTGWDYPSYDEPYDPDDYLGDGRFHDEAQPDDELGESEPEDENELR